MSNIILRIIAESSISVKDITLPLQKEDAFITKTFVNLHVRHYYISRSVKSVLERFIVSQLHKEVMAVTNIYLYYVSTIYNVSWIFLE
jgi:hypothetical protein